MPAASHPNLAPEMLAATDFPEFLALVRLFNQRLRDRALAAGLGFLDLYGLTDRGGGVADGAWHIDHHHLLPSAVPAAFDGFLVLPDGF